MANMVKPIVPNHTNSNTLVSPKQYGHTTHTPLIPTNGLISHNSVFSHVCVICVCDRRLMISSQ